LIMTKARIAIAITMPIKVAKPLFTNLSLAKN